MEIEPVTIGFAALVGVMALIMLRVPIAVSLITVSAVGIMAIVGADVPADGLCRLSYRYDAGAVQRRSCLAGLDARWAGNFRYWWCQRLCGGDRFIGGL